MPLTQFNDIAIHEAGHVLICYLISDLAKMYYVTIDTNFGKTIDKHSDGGLIFSYVKHPNLLNSFEHDQFCLLHLSGLAADLVNELDGKIFTEYFYTDDFFSMINHFHYQGDMILFDSTFNKFQKVLNITHQHYNYYSIHLLTNIFSDPNILKILINLRDYIDYYKTVEGKALNEFLNNSYFRQYKDNIWPNVLKIRKKLFTIQK